VLREGEMAGQLAVGTPIAAIANLLVANAHGAMAQYVRSGFKRSPLELWELQWPLLARGLFQS